MKRDSWSLFLFIVAMTKHITKIERQRKRERENDRFVYCIDNASMCTQSSDQVSSLEIRAVKLFLDLYKQMRTIFTNPNLFLTHSITFSYICFREKKRRRKDMKRERERKKRKASEREKNDT